MYIVVLAVSIVPAVLMGWVTEYWQLLVCGLLWFGVYNIALNAAEQRVDAGTTAMLVNVGPLLIRGASFARRTPQGMSARSTRQPGSENSCSQGRHFR